MGKKDKKSKKWEVRRVVIVTLMKEGGDDILVVKPRGDAFTREELEGYLESEWTDKVQAAAEISGIPSYSDHFNDILLVRAKKASLNKFKEKAIALLEEIFTVIHD